MGIVIDVGLIQKARDRANRLSKEVFEKHKLSTRADPVYAGLVDKTWRLEDLHNKVIQRWYNNGL